MVWRGRVWCCSERGWLQVTWRAGAVARLREQRETLFLLLHGSSKASSQARVGGHSQASSAYSAFEAFLYLGPLHGRLQPLCFLPMPFQTRPPEPLNQRQNQRSAQSSSQPPHGCPQTVTFPASARPASPQVSRVEDPATPSLGQLSHALMPLMKPHFLWLGICLYTCSPGLLLPLKHLAQPSGA